MYFHSTIYINRHLPRSKPTDHLSLQQEPDSILLFRKALKSICKSKEEALQKAALDRLSVNELTPSIYKELEKH